MIDDAYFLKDDLLNANRTYKKNINKMCVILVLWVLIISFLYFISINNRDVTNNIENLAFISVIPFAIYFIINFKKLNKTKSKIKELTAQSQIHDEYMNKF